VAEVLEALTHTLLEVQAVTALDLVSPLLVVAVAETIKEMLDSLVVLAAAVEWLSLALTLLVLEEQGLLVKEIPAVLAVETLSKAVLTGDSTVAVAEVAQAKQDLTE
jgi:hypothetical protein